MLKGFWEFFSTEPVDTPILDTVQRATEAPTEFLDSMLEHLDALRKHLTRAVLVLFLASGVTFVFMPQILEFLAAPAGGLEALRAFDVTEPIGVVMKVALLGGFTISLPYIAMELLFFIGPGISRRSRLIGLVGVPFIFIFFIGGIAFTYLFMLGPALDVLLNFMNINTLVSISSYLNFITTLMFWVGFSFEFPILAFLLSAIGLIRAKLLRQHWRTALILLAVLAAMITPTVDPINMTIVLGPLWVLYGLSIIMAWLGSRLRKEPKT
jgi:sec-independent protein translocase protein TatC